MRLGGTKSLLAMLYDDRMDILRYTHSKNSDGTTETSMKPEPVLTEVPCRLSFSNSTDNPDDLKVDENPIEYMPRIFCLPDVPLQAGDYVIVYRKDDDGNTVYSYKGNIAHPNWYSNHVEVKLNINESA